MDEDITAAHLSRYGLLVAVGSLSACASRTTEHTLNIGIKELATPFFQGTGLGQVFASGLG
jgi:hypothetical protein